MAGIWASHFKAFPLKKTLLEKRCLTFLEQIYLADVAIYSYQCSKDRIICGQYKWGLTLPKMVIRKLFVTIV